MAEAATLGPIRLALVAGFLTSCSTDGSAGARMPPGGGDADAHLGADARVGADARIDPECSFAPCGGDLVGSWAIERVCLASIIVQNCSIATLDPHNVTVTGSFTFGLDGMLTIDIASNGTWEGVVPSSCVTGTDCYTIAGTLFQPNAPPATCAEYGDGGCACSSPVTPTQRGTRPYRVSGTTAASMSFCVENDSLKLMNEAGTVFAARRLTSAPSPSQDGGRANP